jgi:hypothetical protein
MLLAKPLSVCGFPSAMIRTQLFFGMFGVSHWFLSTGTMVRDGTSAPTLMPSRLYHTSGIVSV